MTLSQRLRGLVAVLILASAGAHAADPLAPPSWGPNLMSAPPTDGDAEPVATLALGSEKIYLGSTRLSEVRKLTGVGRIRKTGERDNAINSLCYTLGVKGSQQRLWLVAGKSSLSGLPWDTVDEFTIEALPATATASARCPQLPARFDELDLGHDIDLGAAWADVAESLPGFTHQGEVWFESRQHGRHYYLTVSWWAVRVVDGRVVGVRASSITNS